jgi:hypothetical protein
MRKALDAAWGDFPTEDVGYDWLRYTGNARPSREWCAAVSQHSRLTFIQETYSTRSQEGFQAGVYDCQFAEPRARAVHPGVESIAVVVSDGNYADNWDASEYGRGWASVATIAFFPYGAVPICESFIRGATSVLNLGGTWVPETWGAGTFMSQVVGYSPVADTDLNDVWAPYWPAATPPAPVPTSQEEDDGMRVYIFEDHGRAHHLWIGEDGRIRDRTYDQGNPNPVVVVPVPGDVAIDTTVGLTPLSTFGSTVLYGATKDGRELQLSPSPFGYVASVH